MYGETLYVAYPILHYHEFALEIMRKGKRTLKTNYIRFLFLISLWLLGLGFFLGGWDWWGFFKQTW